MDLKKLNNSMTNVIKFPSKNVKVNHPDLTNEEREQRLLQEKIFKIEECLEYVCTESIGMVHRMGFDITQEDYVKDVTLIVDAFRGLMYKSMKMEHPIHDFVDKNYKLSDDEGLGNEYAYNPQWVDESEELSDKE